MDNKVIVKDNSQTIILDAGYINGIKHLQYHSRLDEAHYKNCNSCYEAHLDFIKDNEE